jgi:hypothetical protein
MRTVELVSRRRVWMCDQCDETQGVREYLLPYTPSGARKLEDGRYRDLCQTCQRRIEALEPEYITPTTNLASYRSARHASGKL